MNFEDFQKAWQSQDVGAKIAINTDMLLKEVRRNRQQFRATIFWRDVREAGVAILLAIFFTHTGVRSREWTYFLPGVACLGGGRLYGGGSDDSTTE